jgi:hypothetical protein
MRESLGRDDLVNLRAVRGTRVWTVRKRVAGAERTTTLGDPHKTLRQAKTAVQADRERVSEQAR